MILNQETLTKILTMGQPEKPGGHYQAIQQQERVRMHSVPKTGTVRGKSRRKDGSAKGDISYSSQAFTDLIEWLKSILPRDKARVARNLIRNPLDSVSLMGEAYQQLERAFDGIDATEKYVFRGQGSKEDWSNYRTEKLGGREYWRTKGMQILRGDHNGIVVVDMKNEPNSEDERPEPYWYVLDLSRAFSYSLADDSGQLDHLIHYGKDIEENGLRYRVAYCYDREAYRVAHVYENGRRVEVVSESAHELGYCPARFFWSETVNAEEPTVRQHPATDYLGALDWYQLSVWFSRYGDLFNGWPITTTFQQSCNYRTETEYCEDGFLRSAIAGNETYLIDGDDLALCPACKDRNSIGPGTNYEVPLPNSANGNTIMLPAVGLTKVDVDGLRYQTERTADQAKAIFSGIVGSVFEAVNNQAINEKQVASLFEARKKAIMKVAAGFESIQSWAESTVCRLRYASDFLYLEINYGTEFFLFSEADLLAAYIEARDAGLGPALLDELQELYFHTRHRRQPKELERAGIIFALDPARHVSNETLNHLLSVNAISLTDYKLKTRLSSLLARFEREKGSLIDFAPSQTKSSRINAIRATLLSYLEEEATNDNLGQQAPQIDTNGQEAEGRANR